MSVCTSSSDVPFNSTKKNIVHTSAPVIIVFHQFIIPGFTGYFHVWGLGQVSRMETKTILLSIFELLFCYCFVFSISFVSGCNVDVHPYPLTREHWHRGVLKSCFSGEKWETLGFICN